MNKIREFENDNVDYGVRKLYRGYRVKNINDKSYIPCVEVNNSDLQSSLLEVSNEGDKSVFDWGYRGYRCKNLSYSILSDYFDSGIIPPKLTIEFLREFVSVLNFYNWTLTDLEINNWLSKYTKRELRDMFAEEIEEVLGSI